MSISDIVWQWLESRHQHNNSQNQNNAQFVFGGGVVQKCRAHSFHIFFKRSSKRAQDTVAAESFVKWRLSTSAKEIGMFGKTFNNDDKNE